jgi:hypothetical protein
MVQLMTLAATASQKEILSVLKRDGAVILADMLSPDEVDQVLSETLPYI